jgi:tetratricopeptide (TPR) repeat protein
VARFNLGCLLYFLGRRQEAIEQWRSAAAIDPKYFSDLRALGWAYAQDGKTEEAAAQLELAIRLNPSHTRTLNDLSSIYARAGKFDEQIALLKDALKRSAGDDDLEMALLNAFLIKGQYQDADAIVKTHTFAPRHRSTTLRDAYRNLRYGMGAVAFNHHDYAQALAIFQSALKPPVSLGVDDFQFESTPKVYYYIGRTLEALGRKQDAADAYRASASDIDLLSGDRDSWNSENFYAVLALDRLGEVDKARALIPHFDGFARTEMDESNPVHRGQARFLLALIAKYNGQREQAQALMQESVQALPDFLMPRYELRGDAIDPIVVRHAGQ